MHFELSPLIVWIALWIVNTRHEFPVNIQFQVNIFDNNRDITKCQLFCTPTTTTTATTTTTPMLQQYLGFSPKTDGLKMHFELSSVIVWIDFCTVNTYPEFQVNIFSNNRDITKCHSFCTTTTTDNDDAKAIAIPRVFSKNGLAKNMRSVTFDLKCPCC